jgi:hydrogenase maturation protease
MKNFETMQIGIIGIGNPLRHDDGIGIVLLEKLREEKRILPKGVEFVDGGTGGMTLLHLLPNYDVVLIIDAVDFAGKPGEYKVFDADDVQSKKPVVTQSTHGSDFLKILDISKQLKEEPKKIYIFGIQPQTMTMGQGLSPVLQKNVDSLVVILRKELLRIYHEKG